jgi:hypothetical protein
MANNTVVSYILQVDTDKGEANLTEIATAAKEASKDLEKAGDSAKKAGKKMKQSGKDAKEAGSEMRALRRAGRDLDGALMDLGQGISLVSPAMGNLVMNLSDAASIAEGVGRIGTLILNPAFITMAGIVTTLGFAFVEFNREQEAAKEQAEALQKNVEATNQAFSEQEDLIGKLNQKLGDYIAGINDASLDLAMLTGAVTAFEVAQDKATFQTEKFRAQAQQQNTEALESAKQRSKQIQTTIIALAKQLKVEQDLANANISSVKLAAGASGELSKQGKITEQQLKDAREQQAQNNKYLRSLEKNTKTINKQFDALEEVKQKNIEITEQKRIAAEEEKTQDNNRKQREKERLQAEKRRDQLNKEATARLKAVSVANNKLDAIGLKLSEQNLDEREKILRNFKLAQKEIRKNAQISGENVKAVELENQLIENTKDLLDEVNEKEKERVDILKEQKVEAGKILDILGASVGALQSPESFVSGLGGILGSVGDVAGFAGLSAAAPAVSAAGSALSSVAGLGCSLDQ